MRTMDKVAEKMEKFTGKSKPIKSPPKKKPKK
jgi:hypothetical protein